MRDERAQSPLLRRSFFVADNQSLTTASCPVDGTQLVAHREYDTSGYSCPACGLNYSWGLTDPEQLRREAQTGLDTLLRDLAPKPAKPTVGGIEYAQLQALAAQAGFTIPD